MMMQMRYYNYSSIRLFILLSLLLQLLSENTCNSFSLLSLPSLQVQQQQRRQITRTSSRLSAAAAPKKTRTTTKNEVGILLSDDGVDDLIIGEGADAIELNNGKVKIEKINGSYYCTDLEETGTTIDGCELSGGVKYVLSAGMKIVLSSGESFDVVLPESTKSKNPMMSMLFDGLKSNYNNLPTNNDDDDDNENNDSSSNSSGQPISPFFAS